MSKFSPLQLWHYKANGHITGRATQVPKVFQTKCQSNIELLGQAIAICHRENFICLKIAPKQGCSVGWRESAGCWVQACPPPKKRQFLRGSYTFCNMAINFTNYSDMMHDVFLLVIYIVCFCCCCCCLPWRNKYAKRVQKEWRDRMDLRGIDSNSKLHVLLKIKHDFWNDFRWNVYNQQETNSPIVLTSMLLSYICFYLSFSIVHLSSKNGDRDIANLTHPSVP